MSIEGITRNCASERDFEIGIFSFFVLPNFYFACPGKKTEKDTMIQDGPPDIPDNI
jgi:hypothetical protein